MEALGILAGGGLLPLVAAGEARRQGLRVVAVAIREEADPSLAGEVDAIHWVQVGQLGAAVRALREERVTDVVLLGKVEITRLFSRARPDLLGAKVLLKARDLRGDSLLEAIVEGLAAEGIRVVETPRFSFSQAGSRGALPPCGSSATSRWDVRSGVRLQRCGLDRRSS